MTGRLRRSLLSPWTMCLGYLALIYGSLPWARGAVVALRAEGMLSATVTLAFFAATVAIAYHVVFDVRLSDRIAFFALVLLAAAIGSLVLGLEVPEERVHFLEYGGLALLAYRAFARHFGAGWSYALASVFSLLAGWGDELIQGFLPDRVYDLRDVAINGAAAVLALAGSEVLHDRLRWQGRRA